MLRYFIGLLLVFTFSLCAKQTLRVSNHLWPPHYTTADGDGLYQEIVRQVYADYEVEFIPANYTRSKNLVKNGKADLWLGAYADEEDFALYPQQSFDLDNIVIVFKRGKYSEVGDLSQFNNAMATWIKEYEFQRYFVSYHFSYYESENVQTALKLLDSGKVDVFIEDESDLLYVLKRTPNWQMTHAFVPFQNFGLYPGFGPSEQAKQWIIHWDKTLKQMKEDGRLRALFARFKEPYLFP